MSDSDSSSDSINSEPYTTRYGRKTKPRKPKFPSEPKPNKSGNNSSNKMGQPIQMTDAQMQQLLSTINNVNNPANGNKLTTMLTESTLPKFAGRRRPHDKYFVQQSSFSDFLREAEALMDSQRLTVDSEKINFLSVLADKNVGDFSNLISSLKTHPCYRNSTYAQVVEHLKSHYATSHEASFIDCIDRLLLEATSDIQDRNLITQRVWDYNLTVEKVFEYYFKANPVAKPIYDPNDTEDMRNAKYDTYAKDTMRELLFQIFFGNKVTTTVNKCAFPTTGTRNYTQTMKSFTDAIIQTPSHVPCLRNEIDKPKKHSQGNVELYKVETESAESLDSNSELQTVETYYSPHQHGNTGSSENKKLPFQTYRREKRNISFPSHSSGPSGTKNDYSHQNNPSGYSYPNNPSGYRPNYPHLNNPGNHRMNFRQSYIPSGPRFNYPSQYNPSGYRFDKFYQNNPSGYMPNAPFQRNPSGYAHDKYDRKNNTCGTNNNDQKPPLIKPCFKCNKSGHLARNCPNATKKPNAKSNKKE